MKKKIQLSLYSLASCYISIMAKPVFWYCHFDKRIKHFLLWFIILKYLDVQYVFFIYFFQTNIRCTVWYFKMFLELVWKQVLNFIWKFWFITGHKTSHHTSGMLPFGELWNSSVVSAIFWINRPQSSKPSESSRTYSQIKL